jgi:predicted nucleic acid-binding protein
MKVFLDTNVLLDILMVTRENNVDSTSILRIANAGYIQAVVTSQSIIDAYYVLVNVAKTPKADFMAALSEVLTVAKVEAISESDIRTAMSCDNNDFEDASQLSCASAAGCDYVVSSDKKMKRDSSLSVYTPKEFCDMVFTPWR